MQLLCSEVRPKDVSDIKLGIGELPQQEIADAEFASCTDQEIRIGKTGRSKVSGQAFFVDRFRTEFSSRYPGTQGLNSVDQFRPASVVKGYKQPQSCVAGGKPFSVFDMSRRRLRKTCPSSDDSLPSLR